MERLSRNLEELLDNFVDKLSVSDILNAKLQAEISGAIVSKRIDMGLTQKEFAKYLGVTQGMISKWESKDYNFTITGLAHICSKLDLNLEIGIS